MDSEERPPFKLLMDRVVHEVSPNNLRRFCMAALVHVMGDDDAWPFLEPVSPDEVPDYHRIIKVCCAALFNPPELSSLLLVFTS